MTTSLVVAIAVVCAATTPPSAADLAARGQKSIGRLSTSSALWTASLPVNKITRLIIGVTHTPQADRYDFTMAQGEKSQNIGVIIARPNVWYANFGKPEVTRPYEALLPLPALYFMMARAAPMPLVVAGEATVLDSDATSITFAAQLPADKRQLLTDLAREVKEFRTDGGTPEQQQKLAELEALTRGVFKLKVDLATGLILESGTPEQRAILSPVEFTTDDLSDAFSKLPANTAPPPPPTADELKRSVLMAHLPSWKPGAPEGDLDLVLVDPKLDTVRRVPVRTGTSLAGTFLADRRRIAVTVAGKTGAITPVEIDLVTGANRPLGVDNLKDSISLFPVASPDRTKVLVQTSLVGASILASQLWVLDVKTGKSTKLGEPFDQAFANWLPGGDGLVLLSRYPGVGAGEKRHVVTRMTMGGDRIPLVDDATHPLLLADGKTVLYENEATREWNTCDLSGKDVKPFGAGFKGYGAPTQSPDGKSLLMMKYGRETGPRPIVIQLSDFSEAPLTARPGLWAYPSWR